MRKMALSTVRSWKMLQCWWRTGHLPSFFIPTAGIWQLKRPHPREFAIPCKKRGQPGGGLGVGGIDWCIIFWTLCKSADNHISTLGHLCMYMIVLPCSRLMILLKRVFLSKFCALWLNHVMDRVFHHLFCVIPQNIHTHPTKGHWTHFMRRMVKKAKFWIESMKVDCSVQKKYCPIAWG